MANALKVTEEQLRDLEAAAKKVLHCVRTIRRWQKVAGPSLKRLKQTGFSARLIEARMSRKILQRDLAAAAGMSAGQLCLIETGKSVPTINMVYRLSRALGLKASELVGD